MINPSDRTFQKKLPHPLSLPLPSPYHLSPSLFTAPPPPLPPPLPSDLPPPLPLALPPPLPIHSLLSPSSSPSSYLSLSLLPFLSLFLPFSLAHPLPLLLLPSLSFSSPLSLSLSLLSLLPSPPLYSPLSLPLSLPSFIPPHIPPLHYPSLPHQLYLNHFIL